MINYPREQTESFGKEFYGEIVNHLTQKLLSISYTSEYLNSLLEILETEWSYIPSSTSKAEVADVSLYNHVKLTATFASCIMEWLEEKQITNYTEVFEQAINNWFLEQFGTVLYLGYGSCECNTLALHNEPNGAYRNIFKQVSVMISKKKMHRYSAKQIISLNKKESKEKTRECKVCRTSDGLTEEDICRTCDALIKISKHILYKGFYAVTKRNDIYPSFPLPFGKYLIAQKEESLLDF